MGQHRFYVPPKGWHGKSVYIYGKDAQQIRVVLRLRPGDTVRVFDGTGVEWSAVLQEVQHDKVVASLHEVVKGCSEPSLHITVVQSLARGDKVEQVIQRGTEIGVSRFVLVEAERSVVRLEGTRAEDRLKRWRRIAKEAAEQARRVVVPAVEGVFPLKEAFVLLQATQKLMLHPMDGAVSLAKWAQQMQGRPHLSLFVGPEGGFSDSEVSLGVAFGALPITLMPRILRTETAALVAVSQLLLLEQLDDRSLG